MRTLYICLLACGWFRLLFEFLNSFMTGTENLRAPVIAMAFFLAAIAIKPADKVKP